MAKKQSAKERQLRKSARALFMVNVGYAKKEKMIVFSENISIGGVFLETSNPLPPGTKVKLNFPLKSAYKPIQIQGKVIWNRKELADGREIAGMGIAFEKINKGEIKMLREFLDNIPTAGWFL